MEMHKLGRSTIVYVNPTWNGHGFAEAEPDGLWHRLSSKLKQIALAEMCSGNRTRHIQEDEERSVIVLTFEGGPLTPPPSDVTIKVHTQHEYGNYCYDHTKATYEDVTTGSFLTFDDPEYQDPE
jgi:hypothetical protein